MRSFLALAIPDGLRADLATLMRGFPVGRPVPPENFHVTLVFLDDQSEAILAELDAELAQIEWTGFDLRLDGLATFGDLPPRQLYAAIAPSPALAALQKAARRAARSVGIDLASQRFVPHITLARMARADPREAGPAIAALMTRAAQLLPDDPFAVGEFGLYRSRLTPEGAKYECLAQYPATNRAAED